MPFLLPNQQRQSIEGNYHIRIREKTLEFSLTVLPALSPYRKKGRKMVLVVIFFCTTLSHWLEERLGNDLFLLSVRIFVIDWFVKPQLSHESNGSPPGNWKAPPGRPR